MKNNAPELLKHVFIKTGRHTIHKYVRFDSASRCIKNWLKYERVENILNHVVINIILHFITWFEF